MGIVRLRASMAPPTVPVPPCGGASPIFSARTAGEVEPREGEVIPREALAPGGQLVPEPRRAFSGSNPLLKSHRAWGTSGCSVRSNSRNLRTSEDFPAPPTPYHAITGTCSPSRALSAWRNRSLLVRAIREVMGDYRRVIAEWSLSMDCHLPRSCATTTSPPPSGHLAPPDSASRRQATDAHPIHSANLRVDTFDRESAISGR